MLARLKVGDVVQVISGKDKGKKGQVIALNQAKEGVKVRDVAMVTKFVKSARVGEPGQMVKIERFIHVSKVMPVCPESGKPCRVRTKVLPSGDKVRVSHRSGVQL